MSTLKVNSIQHSNGTDALTIDSAGNTSFSGVVTGTPLGNRNLIINGDMRIAQRGTSTTGLQYNNDNNYPCCDRWKFQEFGSISYTASFTGSQDTDVPSGQGFDYSMKLACTTADATLEADTAVLWAYHWEGQMLQHLAYGTSSAKTMTLSFWVKSNLTGIFSAELYQFDVNLDFGYEYTIDTANTWEKKTITIPANTLGVITNDNTAGLVLRFNLAFGSNYQGGATVNAWQSRDITDIAPNMTNNIGSSTSNYINITGVQLEVGEVATPFEHRPYDMELQRCKRYYYTTYPIGVAPGTVGAYACQAEYAPPYNGNHVATWQHPVSMRATPTMTGYAEDGTSGSFTTGAGNQTAQFYQTTSAVITPFASFNGTYLKLLFTASAEL